MTTITPSTFYTPLYEPGAGSESLPTGFDAGVASLLAACCQATYTQLANWGYGPGGNTYDLVQYLISTLSQSESPVTFTAADATLTPFTSYEPLDFGITSTAQTPDTGDFVPLPFGFTLQVSASSIGAFNVIALRGTQSYAEWIEDADAVPASFNLGNTATASVKPGFVHGGFYDVYTRGTPGQAPSTTTGTGFNRIPGSIAAQVAQFAGALQSPDTPLYVTGHSLGAALATLCAADLVMNWGNGTDNGASAAWQSLDVYVLASPRVAAGFQLPSTFLNYFVSTQAMDNAIASVIPPGLLRDGVDAVAALLTSALSAAIAAEVDAAGSLFATAWGTYFPSGSYAIANAADIVPILPSTVLGASDGLGVTFQQAIPTSQIVSFCAQMGDVGLNHTITTYTTFVQLLQS